MPYTQQMEIAHSNNSINGSPSYKLKKEHPCLSSNSQDSISYLLIVPKFCSCLFHLLFTMLLYTTFIRSGDYFASKVMEDR